MNWDYYFDTCLKWCWDWTYIGIGIINWTVIEIGIVIGTSNNGDYLDWYCDWILVAMCDWINVGFGTIDMNKVETEINIKHVLGLRLKAQIVICKQKSYFFLSNSQKNTEKFICWQEMNLDTLLYLPNIGTYIDIKKSSSLGLSWDWY